jgi:hypothetical protein
MLIKGFVIMHPDSRITAIGGDVLCGWLPLDGVSGMDYPCRHLHDACPGKDGEQVSIELEDRIPEGMTEALTPRTVERRSFNWKHRIVALKSVVAPDHSESS